MSLSRAGSPERHLSGDATLDTDSYAGLLTGLRALATGSVERFDYAPIDPTFVLRGHRWSEDAVELAWFVDEGLAESGVSSETGIGVLLQVDAAAVLSFVADLVTEGAGA